MMLLKNFVDGLNIIRPHYTNPDGDHLDAGYDFIGLHATDTPLSAQEN